jgi:hypothetical protein
MVTWHGPSKPIRFWSHLVLKSLKLDPCEGVMHCGHKTLWNCGRKLYERVVMLWSDCEVAARVRRGWGRDAAPPLRFRKVRSCDRRSVGGASPMWSATSGTTGGRCHQRGCCMGPCNHSVHNRSLSSTSSSSAVLYYTQTEHFIHH